MVKSYDITLWSLGVNKMNGLISRQTAIEALERDEEYNADIPNRADGVRDAIITISSLPSAEPKKGTWVGKEQFVNSPEFYSWQCSVCGCVLEDPTLDKPYPFCPNCGADMRGEQDE